MHYLLRKELIAEHIKTIVDSTDCQICGKSGGDRYRYPCGHTGCWNCVEIAPDCSLCSPRSPVNPVFDGPSTARARHATELLETFRATFNVDVSILSRISEQQRIEKELFPECIQVNETYYNKRKSSLSCYKGKENKKSVLPGEITGPFEIKMDPTNSFQHVEQWLEKNKPYYGHNPLSDLPVNRPNSRRTEKKGPIIQRHTDQENNENGVKLYKSRSEFKTALTPVKAQSIQSSVVNDRHKIYRAKHKIKFKGASVTSKRSERDESGIIIDDSIVMVDDNESDLLDKDKQAWLAVLEADKKQDNSVTTDQAKKKPVSIDSDVLNWMSSENTELAKKTLHKVPFYKLSNLAPAPNKTSNITKQFKIETSKAVVTVTVTKDDFCHTTSKLIQTDPIQSDDDKRSEILDNISERKSPLIIGSTASLTPTKQKCPVTDSGLGLNKSVIISESSSDSDSVINSSFTVQVVCDVHASDDGSTNVLKDVTETNWRSRPLKRRSTPPSSDSSDKENRDPNAKRRRKQTKKSHKKKW